MSVTEMPFTHTTEAEWQTRVDLAACYRLVDLFGWSDLINACAEFSWEGFDDGTAHAPAAQSTGATPGIAHAPHRTLFVPPADHLFDAAAVSSDDLGGVDHRHAHHSRQDPVRRYA